MPATPIYNGLRCASISIESRLHKRAMKRSKELGLRSFSDYVSRLLIAELSTSGTKVKNTDRRFRPAALAKPAPPAVDETPVE